MPALDGIGRSWEAGDLSLSQVYMGARICEELIGEPARVRRCRAGSDQPRVAMAALDDHHLLGKRMVLSVMRGCGFDVDDYGVLDAQAWRPAPMAIASRSCWSRC